MKKFYLVLVCLIAASVSAQAQGYLYATGQPTYGTSLPIDQGIVGVNNGEIHLEIPLALYKQRGALALNEKLVYDSRIWKIAQNGSSYSWQPTNVLSANGGWRFSSGAGNGVVTYTQYPGTDSNAPDCPSGSDPETYMQDFEWYWTDSTGTVHAFPSVSTVKYNPGDVHCNGTAPEGNATSRGSASDGSGYTLSVTNYTTAVITSRDGTTYHPTTGGNITDRNGNYFSTDANGNLVGTNGVAPILTTTSGNQTTYSVIGVGGVRNKYTVTTTTVNFNTSFGESAVTEASGSFTAIQSIALPDGSSYQFAYDSGTSAGHYGELTSMTLPTGGVVSYGWSNFVDSFSNSNRWLASLGRDGGTTAFTPTLISKCSSSAGCQESMSVQTPDNNATVYTFNLDKTGLTAGSSWVQGTRSYQGSASSGTLLRSTTTNYTYSNYSFSADENGTFLIAGSYEVPASIVTTVTLNDVGLSSQTTTTLDSSGGLPTDVKVWDFGASTSGTPTRETTTLYGPWGQPTSILVKDGSGNQISKVSYGYDETTPSAAPSGLVNYASSVTGSGNQTSAHQWINTTGSTLDSSMTYDSAGAVLTSTQPEGTTKYGYDSTDTFVTSTALPTPSSGVALSSSSVYDASTGLITGATDFNSQTTTYKGYDFLNRVGEIDYSDGGKKTFPYNSPNNNVVQTYLNASSTEPTYYDTDTYGRQDRISIFNGQSANQWYQQDSCFDTSGRLHFQTYSYQGTGLNGTKVCSGAGDTITYDGLGRVASVTHADNTSIQYYYKGRATKIVDENGVTHVRQVDGLGRLTSICEVSNQAQQGVSPGSCGQDIPATGFATEYNYSSDPSGDLLTTIAQYKEIRTFTTDSLGRRISTTEPERGITAYTYAYNSTGLVVTRKRPKANQGSSTTLTTTTTQYDALGRLLSVSYDDSLTPTKNYLYDGGNWWAASGSQQNLKGRLSLAYTSAAGTLYSYDQMGRVINTWQCTPSTCGNGAKDKPMSFAYDWTGALLSQSDLVSGTITYGRSTAGEITSMTNSTFQGNGNPANLVSKVVNGPDGPFSYQLGNGLNVFKIYDSLGRGTGRWLCNGPAAEYCNGGVQVYGNSQGFSGSQVPWNDDTATNKAYVFAYDQLNRLASTSLYQASSPLYTYAYDLYGNRWSQAASGGNTFSASFDPTTNRINSAGYTYDAAGNVTNDSFHNYTVDAEGNILNVDGGSTATYVYDTLNQRVQSQVGGTTLEYIYDYQGRKISTWAEPANTGTEGRIYSDTQQIAFRSSDGNTYFDHQDYLGTERMRTNSSGAVVSTYSSLPWGDGYSANVTTGAADQDTAHFASLDQDLNSANAAMSEHAQFRNYSLQQGRWLSPDPYDGSYDLSNPQSFNRYSYVLNNPLSLTDPTGQDGAGTAIGCALGPLGCVAGVIADIGIGELISSLFSQPSFHGSVQPRPNAQPWDEYNNYFSHGSIASAIGLPDESCAFGACGGGMSFQQGSTPDSSDHGLLYTVASIGELFGTGFPYDDWTDPNHRFFGTHYCGPGGGGTETSQLDRLCHIHDDCYTRFGVSAAVNLPGNHSNPLTANQVSGIAGCNQDLANGSRSLGLAGAAVNSWLTNGYGFLYPGTNAH